MTAEPGQDDELIATLNVIPFVDITLVLLIIFMLTSSAIARSALRVELPRAASAGAAVDTTLNLVLRRDGQLLLDGDPLEHESAAARIRGVARTAGGSDGGAQAVISADRGVAYGRVITLIDLVKENGIHTFALDVERRASR